MQEQDEQAEEAAREQKVGGLLLDVAQMTATPLRLHHPPPPPSSAALAFSAAPAAAAASPPLSRCVAICRLIASLPDGADNVVKAALGPGLS